jgi:hypothetical protein
MSYVTMLVTMLLWAYSTSLNGSEEPLVVHQRLQQAVHREQATDCGEMAAPAPDALQAHAAAIHLGVYNSQQPLLLDQTARQAAPNHNAENASQLTSTGTGLFDASLALAVDLQTPMELHQSAPHPSKSLMARMQRAGLGDPDGVNSSMRESSSTEVFEKAEPNNMNGSQQTVSSYTWS